MAMFQFGDYSFDSEIGSLKKPDQILPLRPKTCELMAYLICHQERICSKKELLEAVWENRVVVENVLLQSIREIRTALDDPAKDPKFIRNYPRKGYQWIYRDLEIFEPEDKHRNGMVVSTPERTPGRGRLRILAAAVLITLILSLVMTFVLRPFGNERKVVDLNSDQAIRLVLLPFSNQTGEADKKWVELGLMDMVGQSLSLKDDLDLVPSYDIQKTMKFIGAPKAGLLKEHFQLLRQNLGGNWIIHTQIFKENEYRLLYTIYDPQASLRHYSLEGTDLIVLADQMVRESLAIMRPGKPNEGLLAQHFSENADAMRDYGIGRHEMKGAGPKMAKLYLQASLNRDPKFLWAKLSMAYCELDLGDWDSAERIGGEILETEQIHPRLKASALRLLGIIARDRGHDERAAELFTQSLELSLSQGNVYAEALAYLALGNVALNGNQLDAAQANFEKARAIHRQRGNRNSESHAIGSLGIVAAMKGDWDRAIQLSQESAEIHRDFGSQKAMADSLVNLGVIHTQIKAFEKSKSYFEEALAIFEKLENSHGVSDVLLNLGTLSQEQEQWQKAIDLFKQAAPNFKNIGDPEGHALATVGLVDCYAHLGNLTEANRQFNLAKIYFDANPKAYGIFEFTLAKAFLLYKQGQFETALATHQTAKALPFANWSEKHKRRQTLYQKAIKDSP